MANQPRLQPLASDAFTNELGQPIGRPLPASEPPNPPDRTPMEGRYCRLVPLDAAEHGEQLHAAYTAAEDAGDWTYLPYGPFDSLTEFTGWLTSVQDKPDPMFYGILDLRADPGVGLGAERSTEDSPRTCSGLASYLRITPESGFIEVGHIHFARCIQGTSVATEAMYLMMKRVFESGYRRYEWKCDDLNAPSCAAAKRLGFTYEGTFRQATHYKGRNRDTAWFSILDTDWPRLRAEYERWLDPANFGADGTQLTPLNTNAGYA